MLLTFRASCSPWVTKGIANKMFSYHLLKVQTRLIKSHGESKKQICKLLLLDLEDLVRQNCAPRMTDPAQNRLGARQQAAARWRNEDGWGVGKQNGHSQRSWFSSHKAAATIFFLVRSNEDSIAASWTKELRKHVPCLYLRFNTNHIALVCLQFPLHRIPIFKT